MQPHRPPLNIFRIKLTVLNLYKIILVEISQGFHLPCVLLFFEIFLVNIYWETIMNLSKRKQRWIRPKSYPWVGLSFIRITRLQVPYTWECHMFYRCRHRKLKWFTMVAQKLSDKARLESWLMFPRLLWSRNF